MVREVRLGSRRRIPGRQFRSIHLAQDACLAWQADLCRGRRRPIDLRSYLECITKPSHPEARFHAAGRCSWRTCEGFAWLGFFGRDIHSCLLTREVALGCPCSTILGGRRPPSTPMVAASTNICVSAKRSALMPPTQRLSTCRYLSAISVVRRNPLRFDCVGRQCDPPAAAHRPSALVRSSGLSRLARRRCRIHTTVQARLS